MIVVIRNMVQIFLIHSKNAILVALSQLPYSLKKNSLSQTLSDIIL